MRRILNTLVWAVVFFALPAVAFAADGAVDSTGPGLGAGIARNPGAAGGMFVNFILGMVLIESIAIYGLVIAFLLQGKI